MESATVWESSRICAVDAEGQPERGRCGVNYVLSELILGIGEVGLFAGLTQIVSVFDARILRILRAIGCRPNIIGHPQRIGKVMCYAALFDIDLPAMNAHRKELGIGPTVLAPDARKLAFA